MPHIEITVQSPLPDSFRVRQIAGLFDLPPHALTRATEHYRVELPALTEDWQIGVIVGPSGSGKSTVARHAFADALYAGHPWPATRAVIDAFPAHASIKQIVHTLTAVGFSSPPNWLKPYAVLSNGERFRCDLAMAMLGGERRSDEATERRREELGVSDAGSSASSLRRSVASSLVVFDEFTSVVDRTVARIASAAIAKSLRAGRLAAQKFVAVTCHYDVLPWLEPDWVLDMATGTLARGRLHRPNVELRIRKVPGTMWHRFKRHHYLSAALHPGASCYGGFVEDVPAAFTAVLYFPHPSRPGFKEHRTVCLPDFQGIGIGAAMSEFVAACYRATGKPYFSTTGHPALIHHRCRSSRWRVTRRPATSMNPHHSRTLAAAGSVGRITAGFEYVGPPRDEDARRLGIVKEA